MVGQSAMFQCPLCRQVANLTASVSMESLDDLIDGKGTEPDAERHLSPLDQLTPITSSSPMSLDASYQLHSLRDGSVSPTNRDPSMPLDRSQNTVKASSTSKRTSFTSRLQSLLIRGAGGGSSEEAAGPSSSPSRSILVGSPPVASPQPTASAQPIQRLVPRSEAPHWLGDSRGRALESSEESEMDKSLNVEQFRESLDPRHPDPLAGQGPSTPGP